MNKSTLLKIFAMAIALCLAWTPAFADDVTEAINEGLQQYKAGDYSMAAGSLDYAAQLIRQKKGGSLEDLLPKPLSGWTAEEATSMAAGAAMFGGGVTAERVYRKGDATMTVNYMTDSPGLQAMMMMLANPAFAASSGMKLVKVKDQRAMIEYDSSEKSGDLSMVVANKFLITVTGEGTTKDEILAYAKAIDFGKLAALQ